MKYILILAFSLWFVLTGYSQDVLVKMNGDSIPISIIEIQEHYLVYKKLNIDEDRKFTTPRFKLDRIIYPSGEHFVFAEEPYIAQDLENKSITKTSNNLEFRRGFWAPSLRKNGAKLSPSQVRLVYADNKIASKRYRQGRLQNIIGNIVGLPSGFFFGDQIGVILFTEYSPNYKILYISGFGTVLSMISNVVGVRNIKKSAKVYNESLNKGEDVNLGLKVTPNGLGLVMDF